MQAIVEEIEAAVLRVRSDRPINLVTPLTMQAPPQSKLPILYLIDSISKNVNQPYTTDLFPPIITRLYSRVYRDVDGVTKAKMEEMIALWRTSGPGRTDLYGPGVRDAIEREIFGSAGLNPALLHARQPPLTRDVVLQKLHSTLEGKQRESAGKPWDSTVKHQIGVLQAIGDLLNSSQVPNSDLPKIMDQLRSMAPTAPPPPPQVQVPVQPPLPMPAPTPTYPTFNPAAPPSAGLPTPNLPPFPPHAAGNSYGGPTISQNVTPVPSTSTPVPGQTPTPIVSGIPANVADILRNLNASGVLSNPRTPETKSTPLKSALDSYEEMILSMDVRLDALDLNRMSAPPVAHLPQRCKQCGIRFPEGEAKMQAHLDWHYRRNKSSTTASGRGAHRRWLPKAEEWVSDFASNAEAGPGPNSHVHTQRHGSPGGPGAASTGGASKLSAEQLARYALRKVPAPQDPVKAGRPCPICKEHWKAELEDDEWIWRNAIDIAGTVSRLRWFVRNGLMCRFTMRRAGRNR
jgi:pre-mRNA cleavage complex 2 protein Pcf11